MSEVASKVIRQPQERSLDFSGMPVDVALPLLAQELQELAKNIAILHDIVCELQVSPNGAAVLHFRAC